LLEQLVQGGYVVLGMWLGYRILMAKPLSERHLGRPRTKWDDNIKMNLRVVRMGKWEEVIQDQV
jgi:hypothetical protein